MSSGTPPCGDATPSSFNRALRKGLPFTYRMNLDQIVEDDRARLFVKEKDFFDEGVAFEGKLVEVVLPGLRRLVPQNAGEGEMPFLQRKRGGSWRP